ncbi:MAG: DUF4139 domain-containing protein [Cyclobacteriaceae bacterium]
MKKIFVVLFAFYFQASFSQTEKYLDSKAVAVTVFLDKVQVTRTVATTAEAGRYGLVLSGLSAALDPQSIQVSGKGSFTILGVSHRRNFISDFNRPVALRKLLDSLVWYQKQLQQEMNKKEVLEKEEQLLIANQKISGNTQNLTVNELKLMSEYYRNRMTEILSGKSKAADQIKGWNEKISRLNRQIAEQNELLTGNTGEIIVSIQAEKSTPVNLEVKYVVSNAGWTPIYDLRASGTNAPVTIIYRAQVMQSTGENWNDVKVSLSTANPNLSGTKPELYQWNLDIQQPIIIQNHKGRNRELMMAAPQVAMEARVSQEDAGSLASSVSLVQAGLNAEFSIATPQSIPSGPKPVIMDIQHSALNAQYDYSAVPKLDKNAFLMAYVTGWEDLSLLPGNANIFFEGTYVGQTFIDPNQVKDTIALSLGRDPRIVITREKSRELSSRKLIGTHQRETAAWTVKIRNNKNEPIKISVEDQVPVSVNSMIEISGVDAPGANWDKQTGKLKWSLNVNPSENKSLTFRYDIKFPKDKVINGL